MKKYKSTNLKNQVDISKAIEAGKLDRLKYPTPLKGPHAFLIN